MVNASPTMPFDPKIPRELANKLGHEAMRVIELGLYASPAGRQVDIADDIALAVARTNHLPPDHRHTSPRTGTHATTIEVTEETSLSAAARHNRAGLRTLVLNFASPTVAGGGFLLGAGCFTFAPSRHSLVSADAAARGQLTTWITITPDNVITILIPHCEMGQGTPTALAMMAPITICPSAPIFQTLARNPTASAWAISNRGPNFRKISVIE